MEYIFTYTSPIGGLVIASDGENITGLWSEGQKYFGSTLDTNHEEKELPIFNLAKKWLDQYFDGKEPDIVLPLKPKGSEFRQSVWKILREIPYGKTMTYGDIAKQIGEKTGKRMSAQPVGGAVGHNPISIIIPCHRVVGADGSLTGFAGGIDRKVQLLTLEKVPMDGLFEPKKGAAL